MTSHRRTIALAALAVAAILFVGACGSDSDTGSASGSLADGDSVDVDMGDLAFDPSELTVAQGATVTFVFNNSDTIDHEALIGDEAAQGAHEADMMDSGGDMTEDTGSGDDTTTTTGGGMDGMGNKSGAMDPSEAVLVAPGESAEITYTFDETGTVLLGCHQPGHYEGGMKATITVT